MKRHSLLSVFALVLGLGYCGALMAEPNPAASNPRVAQARHAWRHSPDYGGRYSTQNPLVSQGITIAGNVLYYYGDVDMLGVAFKDGFQAQNLSLGGGLDFSYHHPVTNTANMRFSLLGGYLHGNDSARYEMATDKTTGQEALLQTGKGFFRSGFGEVAVGIEWFPFSKAGLYIYAGLGLNLSIINYDFTRVNRGAGQTFGILPMLPVEIGYSFNLTHGFFLNIMASVHQGLLDVPYCNLDAWPIVKSSRFQWGDGYFMLGVSLSYRWQKCEPCRMYQW